jgi:hypothetical protein
VSGAMEEIIALTEWYIEYLMIVDRSHVPMFVKSSIKIENLI